MLLEYELTKKDCYNFGRETLKIKRIKKKYQALFIIPTFLLILTFIFLFLPSYKMFSLVLNTTIWVSIFCIYIYVLIFLSATIGLYKNLKRRSLKVNLNIDNENGINYHRGNISSTINWESIIEIYNTKNLLLVFISEGEALFIPKRVFRDENELNNFWNIISENYNRTH